MSAPRPDRILVIKLADLGDALTITPLLRAVREAWPAARLDVLTSAAGRSVLDGLPTIDRLFVADKHAFDDPAGLIAPAAVRQLTPLLTGLRRERYDLLLLPHHLTTAFGTLKYLALTRAIAACRTVGLDNGRGWFLDVRVPDAGFGAQHEVDYALSLASAVGAAGPPEPRLEIALTEADCARAAALLLKPSPTVVGEGRVRAPAPGTERRLPSGGRPTWIALHAGGGAYSLARRWSSAGFAAVARELAARHEARLVVVGSEVDRQPSRELAQLLDGDGLDLVGRTTPKEAAAILSRCRLLVSNDSGLVHLAAAVGTPTVAVFGPTNDRAWGPYPPADHRVVRVTLPCSPCFYRGKSLGTPQGCATRDCLRLVTPDMVVRAAEELLAA